MKLTKEEVLKYIESNPNCTHRELQEYFGVGSSKISNIVNQLRDDKALLPSNGKAGIKASTYVSSKSLQVRLDIQKSINISMCTQIKKLKKELTECTE